MITGVVAAAMVLIILIVAILLFCRRTGYVITYLMLELHALEKLPERKATRIKKYITKIN